MAAKYSTPNNTERTSFTTVRLPHSLKAAADAEAKRLNTTRSALICDGLWAILRDGAGVKSASKVGVMTE